MSLLFDRSETFRLSSSALTLASILAFASFRLLLNLLMTARPLLNDSKSVETAVPKSPMPKPETAICQIEVGARLGREIGW